MPDKTKLNLKERLSGLAPEVRVSVEEALKKPLEGELARLAKEFGM